MATIVTSITTVWTAIMGWIVTAVESVIPLFYVAETGLTFLGVLAVVALGISIFFLLIGLIQNFLHLRG